MKVGIVTAIYGRHVAVHRFAKPLDGIPVLAVVSNLSDKKVAQEHGFQVVTHSNQPLSSKWNFALKHARRMNADAFLMLGSDDVVDPNIFDIYKRAAQGVDMVAFEDFYILNAETNDLRYWSGYNDRRKGEPAGAGRLWTRSALEKIRWNLWEGSHKKGIDRLSWDKSRNLSKRILNMRKESTYIYDIKDEHSTTSWSQFKHLPKAPPHERRRILKN